MNTLVEELSVLLNKHSRENDSDTPDFILAEFLMSCLAAFDAAVSRRTAWYKEEKTNCKCIECTAKSWAVWKWGKPDSAVRFCPFTGCSVPGKEETR